MNEYYAEINLSNQAFAISQSVLLFLFVCSRFFFVFLWIFAYSSKERRVVKRVQCQLILLLEYLQILFQQKFCLSQNNFCELVFRISVLHWKSTIYEGVLWIFGHKSIGPYWSRAPQFVSMRKILEILKGSPGKSIDFFDILMMTNPHIDGIVSKWLLSNSLLSPYWIRNHLRKWKHSSSTPFHNFFKNETFSFFKN